MGSFERVLRVVNAYERLGLAVTQNGTRLVGKVPHVGPEAWLHVIFPRLSDSDLRQMEDQLATSLPDQLGTFFTQYNGLSLFSDSLSFFGFRKQLGRTGSAIWQPYDIVTPNTLERPADAPTGAVFIGGYDYDGSLVYAMENGPVIHRCSRDSAAPLNTWPDLIEMLGSEAERISKLFDENGRELNSSISTAPQPQL